MRLLCSQWVSLMQTMRTHSSGGVSRSTFALVAQASAEAGRVDEAIFDPEPGRDGKIGVPLRSSARDLDGGMDGVRGMDGDRLDGGMDGDRGMDRCMHRRALTRVLLEVTPARHIWRQTLN